MKAYKIIDFLKRKYPENLAEEWDNSGLIVGDKDSEVSKVFVSLDLTAGALEKAMSSGAQLVVTHHPFIFAGIKRITAHDYLGKRIIDAIRAGISVYSIHTNYDIARMADLNARDLELKNGRILAVTGENEEGEYGFGKIGEIEKPCDLDSFAEKVKKKYRASERMTRSSSPTLSAHFRVWVTVWVRQFRRLKIRTYKRENR